MCLNFALLFAFPFIPHAQTDYVMCLKAALKIIFNDFYDGIWQNVMFAACFVNADLNHFNLLLTWLNRLNAK